MRNGAGLPVRVRPEYDIYGLDGLVFVLSLSLFPLAYLGLLGMRRGLDRALEEAASQPWSRHGCRFVRGL
ncbi:hypothetical protein [Streptomyces sp. NPDC003015]